MRSATTPSAAGQGAAGSEVRTGAPVAFGDVTGGPRSAAATRPRKLDRRCRAPGVSLGDSW